MGKFRRRMFALQDDFATLIKALKENGSIEPHCSMCNDGIYRGPNGDRINVLERRLEALTKHLGLQFTSIDLYNYEFKGFTDDGDVIITKSKIDETEEVTVQERGNLDE